MNESKTILNRAIQSQMKIILNTFIIFAFAYPFPLSSQTYSGQIFDSQNKQALAFVNIGIPAKGVGAISDETGKYKLLLDKEFENDTLQFSLIGYKSIFISAHNYIANYLAIDASIFLEKNVYGLSEVVIKPKNIVTETIGNTISKIKPKDCTDVFGLMDSIFTNAQNKANSKDKYHKAFPEKRIEIGTLFEIKHRETYIEKVQLQFCAGQYDSLKIRLNIYSNLDHVTKVAMFKGFIEYVNVLKSPIYFTLKKNTTLIEIDLTPYNIKVMDDFIVSLETLKPEDYKKIYVPTEVSFGGESAAMSFSNRTPFMKVPLMKFGCTTTISYEKRGNWFTNLFN